MTLRIDRRLSDTKRAKLERYAVWLMVLLGATALGCAPGYQPLPERELPLSEVQPDESEMEGNPLRVVLGLDLPRGFADELEIQIELLQEIVKGLDGTGVDARMNTQDYREVYKDAIRLAEMRSNEVYEGEQRVSYVVQGQLNDSSYSTTYKKPLWYPGAAEGRPGKCVAEGNTSLSLEAITLPKVRRAKKWILTADASESFPANGDCGRPVSGGAPKQTKDDIRRNVVEKVASCLRGPLKKFFAPTAYVVGYQSDGESHFFEVSGGTAAGFDKGDSVVIERMVPLDKGGGAVSVVEGRLTNEVRQRRSFVRIANLEDAEKVERGDRVRATITDLSAALCAFSLEEY